MPVVEVSCPACGVKLKAPDSMIGKKAKCKKCKTSFRIPSGPTQPAGSGSVPTASSLEEAEVMMAEAADEAPVATAVPEAAPVLASTPTTIPVNTAAAEELPTDPFEFSTAPTAEVKPNQSKKNRDDKDEEDEPRDKKKRREEDEPPSKKKLREEGKEKETSKKNRKQDEDEEDEPRDKKKEHEKPVDDRYNPFADYEPAEGEQPVFENPWSDKSDQKKKKKDRDDKDDKDPKAKKKHDEKEEDEPAKSRYVRPAEKGRGIILAVIITGVIGLISLGLGGTALLMYSKQQREEEQARIEREKEKEREKQLREHPPEPEFGPGGAPPVDPKQKENEPEPKPKEKEKEKEPVPKGLPIKPVKTFNVGTLPKELKAADKPHAAMKLDSPIGSVRRLFPPSNPMLDDVALLVQSAPAAGGTNEKLALDFYNPSTKARDPKSRLEYAGDGAATPIADFAVINKNSYFLAVTSGKLHVWEVAPMRKKVADNLDPYAAKPNHAKFGVAAAFFTTNPNQVIVISSAGTVLLYDVNAKKPVQEFLPPGGTTGSVSLGRSIAKAPDGGSVGIAVSGVVYQVKSDPTLEVMRKHELGGEVDRSIGLALSGTPGRLLYVFEATVEGKKDKVVMELPLGNDAKPHFYRFPSGTAAGEPKGAIWAKNEFAGVITDRGVLWFYEHDKKFLPILLTLPTNGASYYFGDDKYFWYVIANPDAKAAQKSLYTAIEPFDDFGAYAKLSEEGKPIPAVRIDDKGLSK